MTDEKTKLCLRPGEFRTIGTDAKSNIYKKICSDHSGWEPGAFGVSGNGSCFYNSTAVAINFDGCSTGTASEQEAAGTALRMAILKSLTPEKWEQFWHAFGLEDRYIPSFNTTRDDMENITVWANYHTILYTNALLGINSVFLDKTTDRLYCGVTWPCATEAEKAHGQLMSKYGSMENARGTLIAAGYDDALRFPDMRGATVVIAWKEKSHFEPVIMRKVVEKCNKKELNHRDTFVRGRYVYLPILRGEIGAGIIDTYKTKYCPVVSMVSMAKSNLKGGNIYDHPIKLAEKIYEESKNGVL